MTYEFTLCKHRGKNDQHCLRERGKEGNNLKWVLKSKLAIIRDLEKNIPRREKYIDKVIYEWKD